MWLLRAQLCKCYACHAVILHLRMASLIYDLLFMVVTAMANASTLLDCYCCETIQYCKCMRYITFVISTACPVTWIPALDGLAGTPNPHLGIGRNRYWLTAEMVYMSNSAAVQQGTVCLVASGYVHGSFMAMYGKLILTHFSVLSVAIVSTAMLV